MLHPFSIFPATGPAAALVLGQKKKAHTMMATTAAGACPNDKWGFINAKFLLAMIRNHALVLIALNLSTLLATMDCR
jgi:hypothetical protein